MSDAAGLDLKAALARIDRDLADTQKSFAEQRKFTAEYGKLLAEQGKLQAEQAKFYAEQAKLTRDRYLAPWLAIAGLIGGIVTVITLLARCWRACSGAARLG